MELRSSRSEPTLGTGEAQAAETTRAGTEERPSEEDNSPLGMEDLTAAAAQRGKAHTEEDFGCNQHHCFLEDMGIRDEECIRAAELHLPLEGEEDVFGHGCSLG